MKENIFNLNNSCYFIKIKELVWGIQQVESDSPNLLIGTDKCFGVCDNYNKIIYIDETLETNAKKRTLKHELTHAFITTYLLERKDNYTEEDLCELVSIYGEDIIKLYNKIIRAWG